MKSLEDYNRTALRRRADYDLAKNTLRRESAEYRDAARQVAALKQAQEILQRIAQTVQQQAHERIASVVSRCLTMVFEQPYTFGIHFERRRGKTDAVLQFKRGDLVLDEPMDEAGGGVIDVAAFAMRLACIALSQPRARPLIVLDEPFKFVSAEFLPNVRKMLETLVEEMGFQIVLVTHIEELQVGKVIRIQ